MNFQSHYELPPMEGGAGCLLCAFNMHDTAQLWADELIDAPDFGGKLVEISKTLLRPQDLLVLGIVSERTKEELKRRTVEQVIPHIKEMIMGERTKDLSTDPVVTSYSMTEQKPEHTPMAFTIAKESNSFFESLFGDGWERAAARIKLAYESSKGDSISGTLADMSNWAMTPKELAAMGYAYGRKFDNGLTFEIVK